VQEKHSHAHRGAFGSIDVCISRVCKSKYLRVGNPGCTRTLLLYACCPIPPQPSLTFFFAEILSYILLTIYQLHSPTIHKPNHTPHTHTLFDFIFLIIPTTNYAVDPSLFANNLQWLWFSVNTRGHSMSLVSLPPLLSLLHSDGKSILFFCSLVTVTLDTLETSDFDYRRGGEYQRHYRRPRRPSTSTRCRV